MVYKSCLHPNSILPCLYTEQSIILSLYVGVHLLLTRVAHPSGRPSLGLPIPRVAHPSGRPSLLTPPLRSAPTLISCHATVPILDYEGDPCLPTVSQSASYYNLVILHCFCWYTIIIYVRLLVVPGEKSVLITYYLLFCLKKMCHVIAIRLGRPTCMYDEPSTDLLSRLFLAWIKSLCVCVRAADLSITLTL